VKINKMIRKARGYPADVPVVKGERLISLMNNRHLGLFNGSQVMVENTIGQKKLLLDNGGRLIEVKYLPEMIGLEKQANYDKKKGHPFDWAYGITAHKAQGSEWDAVVVVDEPLWGTDRVKWRYTAASRAKKMLYWIAVK
jgi:exodeoxyribonuclease-5